ncbi:MAG: hypothetical protein OEV08_10705, partial [Nitrospira sp.]|nr:hypothetical protein [Nitrospira sp.]
MRRMIYFFRSVGFFTLLIVLTATTRLSAAEKIPGTLTVQDYLTSPIQEADIEVSLTRKGAQPEVGLAGEPVELLISGNIVATAKTGGNGRARLSYTPKSKGVMPFTVRVGESGNAEAPEAHAV